VESWSQVLSPCKYHDYSANIFTKMVLLQTDVAYRCGDFASRGLYLIQFISFDLDLIWLVTGS
jgi:hypothetical protein